MATAPGLLAFLRFETPGYLALLALLPLLIVFSYRSLAGLGPIRRWIALAMRCIVIVCMVLALAGAQRVRTNDDLSVIFLLDQSSSIPDSEREAAFSFVSAAGQNLDPQRDQLGVIAFAQNSSVEQLPMATLGIDRVSPPSDPDRTNLADALRMSMALFTNETARRVVVLSDGNENIGTALEEADHFRAAGVPIDVVPIRYAHRNEVLFERLSAPATAAPDETVNLQMVLRSQAPVTGRVQLYHNEELVDLDPDSPSAGFPVQLDAGPNRLTIPIPLRNAVEHRFRAVFEPDERAADTIVSNNVGRAFTLVSGQRDILILHQADSEETLAAKMLQGALRAEKIASIAEPVGTRPLSLDSLIGVSLVVLSNVPAHAFTDAERQALATFVRDFGGGLVMIGGDQGFGAGGWLDTPVEEVMPVSFDVKNKKQIPKGALVLVMHGCEIPEGNYWSERVAIAAVKSLSSRDLVGVMSYDWEGGDRGYWDVPLQPVGNKVAIIQGIKKLAHGDMPDLDPLMRSGVKALAGRPDAAARHMIILSDFDPNPPAGDVIADMKKHGITCTTVAIGFGSHPIDLNKARWIADSTGGKSYSTKNYNELPRIFIKEAQIVRRSLIQESPFTPRLASALPSTVAGLAGEGIPPLGGYVLTTAKPLAQLTLVRETEDGLDPIMAQWQVGLGKTVAFTSGMWTRWGSDWSQWAKFSKLWAQIARWTARQRDAARFDVTTSVQGGVGRVRIEALGSDADAINDLVISGKLFDPDQQQRPLRLTQVGPGQYEGEFDAPAAGSYVFSLEYRASPQDAPQTLQTGVSVAFSPEYRELRANEPLLRELADRSSGRVLQPEQAASVFDRGSLARAETRSAIWEDLIRWMLLLFLLDVAVRRIAIDPLAILRWGRGYIGDLAGRRPETAAATVSSLKGARQRARDEKQAEAQAAARYEPADQARASEELSEALGGASELDAPVVARPTRKAKPTSEQDFTSRLLKAKRQAREKLEDDDR